MSTPIIDFFDYVLTYLPSKRRTTRFIAWSQGCVSNTQRTNGINNSFMHGESNNSYYDNSIPYGIDAKVIYKYSVYISTTNNNSGNNPETDNVNWEKIQDNFIGAYERVRYTPTKICLDYALNRYFFKEIEDNGFNGFEQPDDPITPTESTIYIQNYDYEYPTFLIGKDNSGSSFIFTDKSTGWITKNEDYSDETTYRFTVMIPSSVYLSINSNSDVAEKVVRNFLDNLVASGIFYDIETY